MLHYRKHILRSLKLNKIDKSAKKPCPFCDKSQIDDTIEEGKYMRILRTRAAYDVFEGVPVQDHLMITPLVHRTTLAEFTPAEAEEYVRLIGKYESGDYSVYSRSVTSQIRSVKHVHTHLLKMTGKRVKMLFYMDKPYLMLHTKQRR